MLSAKAICICGLRGPNQDLKTASWSIAKALVKLNATPTLCTTTKNDGKERQGRRQDATRPNEATREKIRCARFSELEREQ